MVAQAIFVEAGHGKSNSIFGGVDMGASGKVNVGTVYERNFAVNIAGKILKILQQKEELKSVLVQGVGIVTAASISKKMAFVNTVMKENHLAPERCFGVAIHMNSSTDKKAKGFEVWYQKNGISIPLANAIAKSWEEYGITPLRPRAVNSSAVGRYGRFYIDDTMARYVIVETGFISNPSEASLINESADRVAEAIAHGILEFIRKLK